MANDYDAERRIKKLDETIEKTWGFDRNHPERKALERSVSEQGESLRRDHPEQMKKRQEDTDQYYRDLADNAETI